MRKLNERLFNEFQDGEFGGEDASSREDGVAESTGGEEGVEEESAAPTEPTLTLSQVRELMGQGANSVEPQKQELSEDQIREMLAYPTVSDDYLRSLHGELDDYSQVRGLHEQMLQGISNHIQKVALGAAQMMKQQVEQMIQPLQTQYKEQVANEFVSLVGKKFPVLADKTQLVRHVIDQMQANGYKSQGTEKDIAAVAKNVEVLARQANPDFKISQPTAPTNSGMPSLAQPGQAGGSSSGKSGKPPWDVFDA